MNCCAASAIRGDLCTGVEAVCCPPDEDIECDAQGVAGEDPWEAGEEVEDGRRASGLECLGDGVCKECYDDDAAVGKFLEHNCRRRND